jgi:hypothetical protein
MLHHVRVSAWWRRLFRGGATITVAVLAFAILVGCLAVAVLIFDRLGLRCCSQDRGTVLLLGIGLYFGLFLAVSAIAALFIHLTPREQNAPTPRHKWRRPES